MPVYVTSPFKPSPELLVSGRPSYLFGSYDDKSSPTQGPVLTVAAVTTTATLVFQIMSGNIPTVGDLITVIGTTKASGNFNVTNVAIASVSCTAAGVCTVTYAISSSTVTTIADVGQVIIPRREIGESLTASQAYNSVAVAAPFNNPVLDQGKSLSVSVTSVGTTGGVVSLQGADFDIDSAYVNIDTVATLSAGGEYHWNSGQAASAGPGQVNLLNYRFYRLNISSALAGTNITVVAKIEC